MTCLQKLILSCVLGPEDPHAWTRAKRRENYRRWAAENPLKVQTWRKDWERKNPTKVSEKSRRWEKKNRVLKLARRKARRRSDPNFRILVNLRTRYYLALTGAVKRSATTRELLGCSIPQLRDYLESKFQVGMSWENYGPVWHVDHKRPCASFDLTDPAQQFACFHYTNLQPMFASENLRKGARISLGE